MRIHYTLAICLILSACGSASFELPKPKADSSVTSEITPRPKGGTLEITPRPKGSTILRGRVEPPPGFRIVEQVTGPFRVLLSGPTAQASVMTNQAGEFEIKGVPLGERLDLTAQASHADSKLMLKALYDMPEQPPLEGVVSTISLHTTAIHALVKHTEKMSSPAQNIPLAKFETMPELIAIVETIENEMFPLMQQGRMGDMSEMPEIMPKLEKARQEMEVLEKKSG